MLQNITNIIPKALLPIIILILAFFILATAMYLSRVIGEKLKGAKGEASDVADVADAAGGQDDANGNANK